MLASRAVFSMSSIGPMDPAIGGPGQALVGERRTRAVAAQALERLAVVVGDDDARVQGEAVAPGTQAVATAYAATGGGR